MLVSSVSVDTVNLKLFLFLEAMADGDISTIIPSREQTTAVSAQGTT